jgi:heme-degrading monooxygenase HmoA
MLAWIVVGRSGPGHVLPLLSNLSRNENGRDERRPSRPPGVWSAAPRKLAVGPCAVNGDGDGDGADLTFGAGGPHAPPTTRVEEELMIARITTTQYPPQMVDQLEAAAKQAGQQMAPVLRAMPGFQGGYWMANRQTGKFMGLTFWDSEEHAQGYEAATAELRAQVAAGSPQQVIEHLEIFDWLGAQ